MNGKYMIPAIVLVLLVLTNPSVKAFKEYLGRNNYAGLKRTMNFFVFSIYQHGGNRYIGIVGNFIKWNTENKEVDPFAEFGGHKIETTFRDSSEVYIETDSLPPPPKKFK